SYVLDFTRKPPLRFEGALGGNISRTESGIAFQMWGEKNAVGDPVIGTFTYRFGSGHPIKVKEEPQYSATPLVEKKEPNEILNDPKAREPILRIIGAAYFSRFRDAMSMHAVDDLQTLDGNFIIGKGSCAPVYCGDLRYAMFILDVANLLAWAVEGHGSDE